MAFFLLPEIGRLRLLSLRRNYQQDSDTTNLFAYVSGQFGNRKGLLRLSGLVLQCLLPERGPGMHPACLPFLPSSRWVSTTLPRASLCGMGWDSLLLARSGHPSPFNHRFPTVIFLLQITVVVTLTLRYHIGPSIWIFTGRQLTVKALDLRIRLNLDLDPSFSTYLFCGLGQVI